MIDPILSLSFSVQSSPGVYALLIGSGVSRSAGIPTGWEVVLDLIRKLAHLQEEDCEPDPVKWFIDKYEQEPGYSVLLESISKTPSERSQLLKSYFEATDEEKEQGLKVPTTAHRAIAELVKQGYIRVIITTNFDHLLEMALREIGVSPTIISTPESVDGAIPLSHSKCTIIKLHGDYLDTRIKNTPKELGDYDDRINNLLDRVFDEYGLIICGWSAVWDIALRASLERCKNHRFATYWTIRSEPAEVVSKLMNIRRATQINIKDADSFFQEFQDKVLSLNEISKPHPLSSKTAVASLKRYIPDPRYRIQLHDLIINETEKLAKELIDSRFPATGVNFSPEELFKRVKAYESLCETLLSLMINGCYWGNKEHVSLWSKALERIANQLGERNGYVAWLSLRKYPALLLVYGGGIAALAARNYDTFAALLTEAKVRRESKEFPLIMECYAESVVGQKLGQQLPEMERRYTPLSDYLYGVLRPFFKEVLPDDKKFEKLFDRYEYLSALVYADTHIQPRSATAAVSAGVL